MCIIFFFVTAETDFWNISFMYVGNFESGWNWFYTLNRRSAGLEAIYTRWCLFDKRSNSLERNPHSQCEEVRLFFLNPSPRPITEHPFLLDKKKYYTAGAAVAYFEYVYTYPSPLSFSLIFFNCRRILAIFLMEYDVWFMDKCQMSSYRSSVFNLLSRIIFLFVLLVFFSFFLRGEFMKKNFILCGFLYYVFLRQFFIISDAKLVYYFLEFSLLWFVGWEWG